MSDPDDENFREKCDHQHLVVCEQCESLNAILDDIEKMIGQQKNKFETEEQKEDLLWDFKISRDNILRWKAHVLRSVNQERAKQDIIANLQCNSVLIIMDWAMKFLQLKYREKQSDWYGKRGLSWHISSVVFRDNTTSKIKVMSFAHLFNSCTQDWYAVTSVLEDLLYNIRKQIPNISVAYLRSDEAGCYHNNFLIPAAKDVGERVGIRIERYDYSEPQQGKDICDRNLCPMKQAIRQHCCEGHDILTASDMREALSKKKIKGTSASVNIVNEAMKTIEIHKISKFSSFHNFKIEKDGIRMWKAFGIGPGKFISFNNIYVSHQQSTELETPSNEVFFAFSGLRELKQNDGEASSNGVFECSEPGCMAIFDKFSDLQVHLDVGVHSSDCRSNETTYDTLRRMWAEKLSSVEESHVISSSNKVAKSSGEKHSLQNEGWALAKERKGSVRFEEHVRAYLTAKFDVGEITGNKSDPEQVSIDMRNARDENNVRLFERECWLTKLQIQGFFSRLAATRRRHQFAATESNVSENNDETIDCLVEEARHADLMKEIDNTLNLKHPVIYDIYDLCCYVREEKLKSFNVPMLKKMCTHFEISFRSTDKN